MRRSSTKRSAGRKARRGPRCPSSFLSFLLSGAVLSGILTHIIVGAAVPIPTCKGIAATVYIAGGIIVGGPNHGQGYAGDLEGSSSADVIVGTEGDDAIESNDGNDIVCGGGGNDDIDGGDGDDQLCGDAGEDVLDGGFGRDTLCGGEGDDEMDGGPEDDVLDGGDGNDILDGDTGTDTCAQGENVTSCESAAGPLLGCDSDDDDDGVEDDSDNCPLAANPTQTDTDGDGAGDACDSDDDNDGAADGADNCPLLSNADQLDTDGDAMGDDCDPDDDNDTVADTVDTCPLAPNADQTDSDSDGTGNACDGDSDGDGAPDESDTCPLIPNPDQVDNDGDGAGDVCDSDDDNDTIADDGDNCSLTPNPDQADSDDDGVGDACDADGGSGDPGGSEGGGGAGASATAGSEGSTADSQPGGRRGSNTNVLQTILRVTIAKALGIFNAARRPTVEVAFAPGAFGGSPEGGFTKKEKDILCAMQENLRFQQWYLGRERFPRALEVASTELEQQLGGERSSYEIALQDEALCTRTVAEQRDTVVAATMEGETEQASDHIVRVFPVDERGRPVSTSDVWNNCIQNHMSFDAERNPYNCERFHNNSKQWEHPDIHVTFEWNNRRREELIIPKGYKPFPMTDGNKVIFREVSQLHIAKIIQQNADYPGGMLEEYWRQHASFRRGPSRSLLSILLPGS